MTESFVHLHVHTEYSMLDGAAKVKPLFAEAARLEMPAIAMSDHGNMFGAFDFYQAAQDSSVKPIIGIEAYVAPENRFVKKPVFWGRRAETGVPDGEGGKDVSGGGRFTHMTMWAKDADGLRNLFRLSSMASFEGYYSKPRMDQDLISQHAAGIIATTGCPSGAVQTRLRLGQYDEAVKVAGEYQEIFGRENYFLELMDHGIDIEREVRADLLKLAKQLNIPMLVTNDSHYVTEDQADAHDSLLCIGVGKNKDDPNRFRFNGSGYYLKTSREMRALFTDLPEACDNTLLVAEMVGDYGDVFKMVDRMPQFPGVPEGETQESWLREAVERGLEMRYGTPLPPEVVERYETEMKIIGPMGFSSYFLVVADICKYARDNGIAVGPGRGSATGSIVAYATRITELCPLEHGLLFERFLNPERISPPDIDLDFDDRHRERMVRYVTDTYGAERTAQVNTFGTIKAKAAVKDSSRILGYPFAVGDKITKAMPPDVMGKGVPLAKLFDEEHPRYTEGGEIRAMYENEPDVKKVIDTGLGIEGLIRGTGVHAAAVILSSEPLLDLLPMHMRDKDKVIITGFDYPSCEAMGLIKMDFLGLRNLGIIDHCIKIVEQNRGVRIRTEEIPLDDATTYELMARGDTLGVFQLDGGPMRALLKLMEPTRFEDIAAVLALYRPGPMAANAHTNYAHRKNARQEIEPIHPELKEALEPILGPTFHLLVYQEQIMAVARELAGYSLGGADLLRRAMGKKKKEILDKEFSNFQAGMRANTYSDESIQALWDVMLPFSGYAFNKSHTAGYGLVAYWTAYLKANYPAEYMAALLTSVGDDKDKMAIYLAECRKMGIEVLAPDVNESFLDFVAVGDDKVRFGLGGVRNVGENVIEGIVKGRENSTYDDFNDFLSKVPLVACNKRVIESLIKAGAFDSLSHPRKGLVMIHEQAVDSVIGIKKNEAHGQDSLFGADDAAGGDESFAVAVPEMEWDRKTKLDFEREMLGLYVSDHPLAGAERLLARHRDTSIAELLDSGRDDRGTVKVSGLITKVDKRVNKAGNLWAIVVVEDMDSAIECLFFPRNYELFSPSLQGDLVVAVGGQINNRDGAISIFAEDLTLIDVSGVTSDSGHPITIQLREERVNLDLLEELRNVLKMHEGKVPLRISLRQATGKTVLMSVPDFPVTSDPSFAADVKALLGSEAIAL